MRVADADAVQVLGDVEIGLVEAQRLDVRGESAKDRADLLRDLVVDVEAVAARRSGRGTAAALSSPGIAERTPNLRAS